MDPSPSPAPVAAAQRYSLLHRLDAHHRLIIGGLVAAGIFALLRPHVTFSTDLVAAWDVFTFSLLVLGWATLMVQDPYEARQNARLQDSSRTFLFILVIGAAMASLLAVGLLLGPVKDLPHPKLLGHIGLSIAAVVLSWALVHTLFAMRYAHYFYEDAREVSREKIDGGLLFPGDESPTYLDFAYFSFVIGMTCQVSDVQISSSHMRRLALIHGLIAFGFNTAILAMFVNIVAGLI